MKQNLFNIILFCKKTGLIYKMYRVSAFVVAQINITQTAVEIKVVPCHISQLLLYCYKNFYTPLAIQVLIIGFRICCRRDPNMLRQLLMYT